MDINTVSRETGMPSMRGETDGGLKAGDPVAVPETAGHKWIFARGVIEVIAPPLCRVKVYYDGHQYRLFYKIREIHKL